VAGVNGHSCIVKYLNYVDVILHMDLDSMHAVYLNVVLHFLVYWFDEKYKNHNFSLYFKLKTANQIHLGLKIPHDKSRPPRDLQNFSDWKASELRY
jgi:hypothetical protein